MSWVDMVKNNLVGTGKVSKGAICGHDGAVWGISEDFKVKYYENYAFLVVDLCLAVF